MLAFECICYAPFVPIKKNGEVEYAKAFEKIAISAPKEVSINVGIKKKIRIELKNSSDVDFENLEVSAEVHKVITTAEIFGKDKKIEESKKAKVKFLDEEPTSTKVDWKAPITTPESKIKTEQFILIAIIGIASVALMAFAIPFTSTSSSTLQSAVFFLSFIFDLFPYSISLIPHRFL